jgi:uncharacterized protein YjcR
MILINTKTNESFTNCSNVFVANKIGIDPNTITRWKKEGKEKENYNYWIIYFNPEKVKQKKGFAINNLK